MPRNSRRVRPRGHSAWIRNNASLEAGISKNLRKKFKAGDDVQLAQDPKGEPFA